MAILARVTGRRASGMDRFAPQVLYSLGVHSIIAMTRKHLPTASTIVLETRPHRRPARSATYSRVVPAPKRPARRGIRQYVRNPLLFVFSVAAPP